MDFFCQKIEQTLGILHNNPLLWSVKCYEPFLKNIEMFNLLKVEKQHRLNRHNTVNPRTKQ